jgi:hypothetical protein
MRELQLTWDRRGYLVQGADASGCSSTLEILGADGRSCAARTFAAPADNCGEETVLSVGRDGTVVQTFVRRRAPGANENRYPTCLWQFWPRLVRSP